jgi:Ca2+-binding RTX toxin-like protein
MLTAACAAALTLCVAPAAASALCLGNAPTMTGTASGETINGTSGDDVIDALGGDDTVNGAGGNDKICGGDGNDIIDGGLGADQLDGGTAAETTGDTVTFASLPTSGSPQAFNLAANLSTGSATTSLANPSSTEVDTLSNFENLTGSNTFDQLTGNGGPNLITGLSSADLFTGGDGNDTLVDTTGGATDQDTASYLDATGPINGSLTSNTVSGSGVGTDTLSGILGIDGSPFNDTLVGDNANPFPGNTQNVLDGMGGDDLLEPLAGTDTVLGGDTSFGGGPGIDTVSYADDAAVVADLTAGTAITDTVTDKDTLIQLENVIGSVNNDTITGDSHPNVIDGLAGNDTIDSAGGVDTASFASLAGPLGVNVNLALGTAVGDGSDTLAAVENVTGSQQSDVLFGDGSHNVLDGLGGNDNVDGQAGPDDLKLGAGNDIVGAADGEVDSIECTGGGPDSGSVDGPAPAETYTACDTDGDNVVDFLDACPTTSGTGTDGCVPIVVPVTPPTTTPPTGTTNPATPKKKCKKKHRAAAAKKCKKRK